MCVFFKTFFNFLSEQPSHSYKKAGSKLDLFLSTETKISHNSDFFSITVSDYDVYSHFDAKEEVPNLGIQASVSI